MKKVFNWRKEKVRWTICCLFVVRKVFLNFFLPTTAFSNDFIFFFIFLHIPFPDEVLKVAKNDLDAGIMVSESISNNPNPLKRKFLKAQWIFQEFNFFIRILFWLRFLFLHYGPNPGIHKYSFCVRKKKVFFATKDSWIIFDNCWVLCHIISSQVYVSCQS